MKNTYTQKKTGKNIFIRQKLLGFMLLFLFMLIPLSSTALAIEEIPTTEIETEPPLPITTPDSLLLAIENAGEGDTIYLSDTILINDNTVVGVEDKTVYIARSEGFSDMMFRVDAAVGTVLFQNLIITGNNLETDSAAVEVCGSVDFNNVKFQNHMSRMSSALFISSGSSVQINNCVFESNIGRTGGHILIADSTSTVWATDTVFSNGKAEIEGGAISNHATLYLTNCRLEKNTVTDDDPLCFGGAVSNSGVCYVNSCHITENIAPIGGGIYNTGSAFINNSLICRNTAGLHSNDIFNTNELRIFNDESFLQLWGEEYESWAWYDDTEENRFDKETNITAKHELPLIVESGNGSSWLTFALAEKNNETPPATEDNKDDSPDDAPIPPVHPSRPSYNPPNDTDKEGSKEQKLLSCGVAVLDTSRTAYLLGYGDGALGEDKSMTRAQMAQILYRLLTDESRTKLYCETNDFSDVSNEAWYNAAVSTLNHAGIVQGYNGCYRPEANLTRAEFLTIITRFASAQKGTSNFSDIGGHWAEENINIAVSMGWIPDGLFFLPDEPITRIEAINLLNRVFQLHISQQS